MLSTYRSWKNGNVVKLDYGEGTWNVAVHRQKKMCRFGLGWDHFTNQNQFTVGQQLEFVYEGNFKF